MTAIVVPLLRVFSFVAGMVCLYVAFLLHEDEDARLQNRLETYWVSVDDVKTASLSRHAVLMRQIAKSADFWISRVCGERLMGLRAAGTAIWCSISATCAVILVLTVCLWFAGGGDLSFMGYTNYDIAKGKFHFHAIGPSVQVYSTSPLIMLSSLGLVFVFVLVSAGLGLAPAFVRRKFWLSAWVVAAIALAAFIYSKLGCSTYVCQQQTPASFAPFPPKTKLVILFLLTVAMAVVLTGSIAFLRRTLRAIARLDSAITITGYAALHLLFSVCLVLVPFVVLVISTSNGGSDATPGALSTLGFALLGLLTSANILPVTASVLYLFAVILLAGHHCLWPFISRPLYALQKTGVVKRRKFIVGIGFALVAFALGVDVAFTKALAGKLL